MKLDREKAVLILGVAMRVFVFLFQDPGNNDYHFHVIKFMRETRTIPLATEMSQAYHPPLYYILAQPFYGGDSTMLRLKGLQLFSLLTSILTFVILFLMIRRCIGPPAIRLASALLAALLPQFIMFGNYISNDSLANLLGALIFFLGHRYARTRRFLHLLLLAAALGLGLLTKATFIAFVPGLILLVLAVQLRDKRGLRSVAARTLLFVVVFTAVGSYKYAQNCVHFGRPFIHNTDPIVQEATGWPWADDQKGTHRGVSSFVDWNIGKLVLRPTLDESTRHSYFLLLYGTLWYQYIHESNLEGNLTRLKYFGSLLYVLAAIPTLLILAGGVKMLSESVARLKGKKWDDAFIHRAFSALVFLSSIILIAAAGLRYDVWSCYQARIFFPAIWGMIILFAFGLEAIAKKPGVFAVAVRLLNVLYACFALYFVMELLLLLKIIPRLAA